VGRATWLLAAGAAAAVSLWQRRRGRRRQQVDLYFADGSMISLDAGSVQAQRLFPLAYRVLAEARQSGAGTDFTSPTAAPSATG
jgi:hypothetical protein